MEFNTDFKKALQVLEKTKKNVFITGKAGTGKSTLLSYFVSHTKQNIVLLAPTGVAALNIRGETIHSFFRLRPGILLKEIKNEVQKIKNPDIFKNIDAIIIDEISMVRADLLDCVDLYLKTVLKNQKPFGGVRMIFIGDLYQLPPVLSKQEKEAFQNIYPTPFFFSSAVMQNSDFTFTFIELEKVYRQKDDKFIQLLNHIRNNTLTQEHLCRLNKRVMDTVEDDSGYIYLTTTNQTADRINLQKLKNLPGKTYNFKALIQGDFESAAMPASSEMKLKKHAQIMFLINHPKGLWVNGTIGKVVKVNNDLVIVETEQGLTVEVEKYEWPLFKYGYDPAAKALEQIKTGSFEQYPLRLAWAITIHKSQGKTFDKVILDLEKGTFAHGQAYVGLSRCRCFKNLILKKAIKRGHIRMDYHPARFLTGLQYNIAEKKCSYQEKLKIIQKAIVDKRLLKITYLKASDEKSCRIIEPLFLDEMTYRTVKFLGLEAYCQTRKANRVFKIERILEISYVS